MRSSGNSWVLGSPPENWKQAPKVVELRDLGFGVFFFEIEGPLEIV